MDRPEASDRTAHGAVDRVLDGATDLDLKAVYEGLAELTGQRVGVGISYRSEAGAHTPVAALCGTLGEMQPGFIASGTDGPPSLGMFPVTTEVEFVDMVGVIGFALDHERFEVGKLVDVGNGAEAARHILIISPPLWFDVVPLP